MGYITNEVTQYKVGDILYGKNSLNAKVVKVHATGAIDIKFETTQSGYSGNTYYYFSAPYRTDIRKEPDKWLLLPANGILTNINMNTNVQFCIKKNTYQSKEYRSCSWWGNLYGSTIVYGDPPYGNYYIPSSNGQTSPSKDLPESEWKSFFGVPSDWSRVGGSYKWAENGSYYGWRRENNYGPYLNSYARRITMTFSKGTNVTIESGHIAINKIKLPVKSYVPEPIEAYIYRTPVKDTASLGYNNVAHSSEFVKLQPYPTVNKFSIPDDKGNDVVNLTWTSKEDEDDSKNDYPNFQITFTNFYKDEGGSRPPYWTNGNSLTDLLTDPQLGVDRLAGKYEFEIKAIFDGKSNQTTSQKFIVEIADDNEPTPPVIVDKVDNTITYDMIKDISVKPHQPRWDEIKNHSYEATYDYFAYENEGYDCALKESRIPFKNGEKIFNADGQYSIKVTAKYRNGKTASTQSVFMIDTRVPSKPVISVNEDKYEGVFLKGEAGKKTYLNGATVSIEHPPFTRCDFEIFYKKLAREEFMRVSKNKLPTGGLFTRTGTWKIVAKSVKTEVKNVDGSEIVSEISEVIFAVKRKYTNEIKLTTYEIFREMGSDNDTNDVIVSYKPVPVNLEGTVKGYKVEADMVFTDGMNDSGNPDFRYILDENGNKIKDSNGNYKTTLDYSGAEILNKLYKLDDGEWKYYLDSVFIYENCTISCKSVDDDGFESNTTIKKIGNLDSKTVPKTLTISDLGSSVIEVGTTITII